MRSIFERITMIAALMALVMGPVAFGGALPAIPAVTASGSLTAQTASNCTSTSSSCVVLPLNSQVGGVGWSISGTFVATVIWEGSVDGTNFFGIGVYPPVTSGSSHTYVGTATAPGIFFHNAVGMSTVRVRCSSYTSGTITVSALGAQNIP